MKIEKNSAVVGIAFLIFIIGAVVYFSTRPNSPRRYTIGTIDHKGSMGGRQGYVVEYVYEINGKQYEGSRHGQSNPHAKIGERYIVSYPENDPDFSYIAYDLPVPDGEQVPVGGWSEIPEWIE